MTIAPRRYSVDDPQYNRETGARLRITVDGDLMRCVIAYDCDAGWVEVITHDDRGRFIVIDGEAARRRYYGHVEASLV